MNLELTGKLIKVYDPQEFGERKFKTREFIVELSEEINGNQYINYAKMQLVQNKCDIIDRFNIGDEIKVSFNIRGRSYTDKKDGSTKYISNLDAWRIEQVTPEQTNNTNQAAAQVYNNNTSGDNYNGAPNFNPSPETTDDLPF